MVSEVRGTRTSQLASPSGIRYSAPAFKILLPKGLTLAESQRDHLGRLTK
jgi:hypothetical protein